MSIELNAAYEACKKTTGANTDADGFSFQHCIDGMQQKQRKYT
jgi:hypothetical protein